MCDIGWRSENGGLEQKTGRRGEGLSAQERKMKRKRREFGPTKEQSLEFIPIGRGGGEREREKERKRERERRRGNKRKEEGGEGEGGRAKEAGKRSNGQKNRRSNAAKEPRSQNKTKRPQKPEINEP